MSTVNIKSGGGKIRSRIILPASKSISNRVLIINALSAEKSDLENIADCDDTRVMVEALSGESACYDVGHAGTSMRFLTAFLAQREGTCLITGSERMKHRPISVLVDALNRIGGNVSYAGESGYPPLKIAGKALKGGRLEVPADVSSQYISALMMIAPYMECGLTIDLKGEVASRTYINMTAGIMNTFGAEVDFTGNVIRVLPGEYSRHAFKVESDWTAASYFFELLSIAGLGRIELPGLSENSLQGDVGQTGLWKRLGVGCSFSSDGAVIESCGTSDGRMVCDFRLMPDLVQTFAVACCLKAIRFTFTGVETLRIKETDRITALQNELYKLGYILEVEGNTAISWNGARSVRMKTPVVDTYEDHRMAMAFAPAALALDGGMAVNGCQVVSKSFPGYWDALKALGMKISYR